MRTEYARNPAIEEIAIQERETAIPVLLSLLCPTRAVSVLLGPAFITLIYPFTVRPG